MSEYIKKSDVLGAIDSFVAQCKYYHPHSKCDNIPIEEMKYMINQMPYINRLTWDNLEDMFGKPVYFVQKETNRNCKAHGWIILYELHITASGSFVIGTDETQLKYEDCLFYNDEVLTRDMV